MPLLSTPRLDLRPLEPGDAPFIQALLTDPDFLRFVGDRGVRSVADAEAYIRNGPMAMYQRRGFGLWLVERREGGVAVGICGLLDRDGLEHPDLGFAFLPEHRGKGYAAEAAGATLAWGLETLGLPRVLAITSPDNHASARVLERIGFRADGTVRLPGEVEEVSLWAALSPRSSRSPAPGSRTA